MLKGVGSEWLCAWYASRVWLLVIFSCTICGWPSAHSTVCSDQPAPPPSLHAHACTAGDHPAAAAVGVLLYCCIAVLLYCCAGV